MDLLPNEAQKGQEPNFSGQGKGSDAASRPKALSTVISLVLASILLVAVILVFALSAANLSIVSGLRVDLDPIEVAAAGQVRGNGGSSSSSSSKKDAVYNPRKGVREFANLVVMEFSKNITAALTQLQISVENLDKRVEAVEKQTRNSGENICSGYMEQMAGKIPKNTRNRPMLRCTW